MPARGLYFPPTLLSNVHPTSIVAQQEIFGPVLAAMTFRTPERSGRVGQQTVYGLAAVFGVRASMWRFRLPRS